MTFFVVIGGAYITSPKLFWRMGVARVTRGDWVPVCNLANDFVFWSYLYKLSLRVMFPTQRIRKVETKKPRHEAEGCPLLLPVRIGLGDMGIYPGGL